MTTCVAERRTLSAVAAVVLVGLVTACGGTAMRRAAAAGDITVLRATLAERGQQLTLTEAAAVARAVVSHEIEAAPTPEYARARMQEARTCTLDVEGALARRARRADGAAGEATLLRVEAGAAGQASTSPDDSMRAAATLELTRRRDRDARLHALLDGSPAVRMAALHAITRRGDPADADAVLEAARLDPEPVIRSGAVRALPSLGAEGRGLAGRLFDLWAGGDAVVRPDVAAALASPRLLQAGGAAALARLLASTSGDDAVTVAAAVFEAGVGVPEVRAAAAGRLISAASSEGSGAAVHAIAVLPSGPRARLRPEEALQFVEVLRKASGAPDPNVRLAALGRLATPDTGATAEDRSNAMRALEELAASPADPTGRASLARLLLAQAGDIRVQAWVENDLTSPEADTRVGAARALAMLGRAARAAPLLADADPSVRTRAACAILTASRHPR